MHTASLGMARWTELSTRYHIKRDLINGLVVVTCAEISPSESECGYYVVGELCVLSRHGERVCEGSLKGV